MKKFAPLLGFVIVALGSGCYEKPAGVGGTGTGPLLRYHFVGFMELGRATNNPKLREVGVLPASPQVREQMVQKLAKAPALFWQKQLPAKVPDQAALFQPLFEDLLSAESVAEVRGPASRPELVLAVAVNEERARLWSTNLWQIVLNWKLGAPQASVIGGSGGWEITKPGVVLQFVRAGQWVVIGLGHDAAGLLPPVLKAIAGGAPPLPTAKNLLFEIQADFPRLGGVIPGLAQSRLPLTYLSVTNRGDFLRTEARLTFSENIPWTYEPWKIPTNLITEPINSFTVARGIAPLWPQLKGASDLGLKSYPNQLCAWGHNYDQGETTVAVPMPRAAEVMNRLSAGLPRMINAWFPEPLGEFYYVSNRTEFLWRSIPFIAPFARTATNGGVEYLQFGMLSTPRREPPPPQLMAAIVNRTNLLYWDFEITGQRLFHGLEYYQLADILSRRNVTTTNLPTQFWMFSAREILGESVTEATLTGPREVSLLRKSHLGFTGFELATIMRWIESPGFPFTFAPSAQPLRRAKPGAPPEPPTPPNPATPKQP